MAAVLGTQEHGLYDSGDEWEVGVGDLIIDLDADLEKDRQRAEEEKIMVPPSPQKVANNKSPAAGKDLKMKVKRSKGVNGAKTYSISDLNIGKKDGDAQYDFDGAGSSYFTPSSKTGKGSLSEEKSGKSNKGGSHHKSKTSDKGSSSSGSSKGSSSSGGSNSHQGSSDVGGGSGCGSGNSGNDGQDGNDKNRKKDDKPSSSKGKSSTSERSEKKKDNDKSGESGSSAKTKGKKNKAEKAEKQSGSSSHSAKASGAQVMPPPSLLAVHAPTPAPSVRHIGVNTSEVGVVTEPECLGPCEPGTSVNLEGIVWHETEGGVLVVNVTWRNKTYVGTLLDCTRHDWAPPRFSDSPTSDLEVRTPKGRGKRARSTTNTPQDDPTYQGPPDARKLRSNGKPGRKAGHGRRTPTSGGRGEDFNSGTGGKRKGKPPTDLDLNSSSEDVKPSKRIRTNSRGTPTTPQGDGSMPALIECPHANCNKKYKHINGLRYHQAHAHLEDEETKEEGKEEDGVEHCSAAPNTSMKEEKLLTSCAEKLQSDLGIQNFAVFGNSQDTNSKKPIDSLEALDSLQRREHESLQKKDVDLKKVKAEAISEYDFPECPSPTMQKPAIQVKCAKSKHDFSPRKTPKSPGRGNNPAHGVFGIKKEPVMVTQAGTWQPPVSMPPHTAVSSLSTGVATKASHGLEAPADVAGGAPDSALATPAIGMLHMSPAGVSQQTSVIQSTGSHLDRNMPLSDRPKSLETGKKSSHASGSAKGEKSSKSKTARPIAPAPPVPQLIAIPATFSSASVVAPPGMQAISTMAQTTPKSPTTSALKPIQPKPTIMGEPTPQSISIPSFKEKKHKQKRKIKEGDKEKGAKDEKSKKESKGPRAEEKSESSSTKDGAAKLLGDGNTSKHVTDTQLGAGHHISNGIDLQSAEGKGSSLLATAKDLDSPNSSLYSEPGNVLGLKPLHVITSGIQSAAADDKQSASSPAYSDISDDGNEQAEGRTVESKHRGKAAASQEPAGSPAAASPLGSQALGKQEPGSRFQSHYASIQTPFTATSTTLTQGKEIKQEPEDTDRLGSDEKPETDSRGEPQAKKPRTSQTPSQESSPHVQDSQQRTSQQQQAAYAQYQHQQYQYLAYHGYRIDPAYHNYLMAADPQYRQQYEQYYIQEQTRLRAEQEQRMKDPEKGDKPRESNSHGEHSKKEDRDSKEQEHTDSKPPQLEPIKDRTKEEASRSEKASPIHKTMTYPSQPPPLKRADDADSLKAKQSENHQILKENIELKTQLESTTPRHQQQQGAAGTGNNFDPRLLYKQQEEMRQYYLIQQKLMEERRTEEEHRRHGHAADKAPHAHVSDKSSHGHTSDKGHHDQGSDKASHSHSSDKASHSHSSEKASHSHSSEKASHSHSSEKASHSHSSGKTLHGHSSDKVSHGHSSDKVSHGHSSEKSSHGHHTDRPRPDSREGDPKLQRDRPKKDVETERRPSDDKHRSEKHHHKEAAAGSSLSSKPNSRTQSPAPRRDSPVAGSSAENSKDSKEHSREPTDSKDRSRPPSQERAKDRGSPMDRSSPRHVPYQYMQQYSPYMHPYAAMHLDPAAYRGMYPIGYAGAPYVHPQFRYQGDPAGSPQQVLGSSYKGQSSSPHDRPSAISPASSTGKSEHNGGPFPPPAKPAHDTPGKSGKPATPTSSRPGSAQGKPAAGSAEKTSAEVAQLHHVHTHHHTHVGVGFPAVGQYDPYNVGVLGQSGPGVGLPSAMSPYQPRRE
ncbi:PREDICTED: zinc finger protein 608-like isoform X1 [Branchiostoma belcheri]|uniref:Zinc finger protein 608-like isoform X1 n=1 Tax=Branchiostoma belcheri TaxID=7741 RepID=A0A6P4Y8Y2_BRABE|nr:PREDICTED: zinc finger protein 608-like isoform X1 [Branchiostoma belcheri]XP_019615258.1 PREDICTED: zinc finger protein 608-like isoform X1 [Branchiostoma belcheri]